MVFGDFTTQVFVLRCALSGASIYGFFLILLFHMYHLYSTDVAFLNFVDFRLLHLDDGPGGPLFARVQSACNLLYDFCG